MERASFIGLLAVGLVIGMSGISGAGLADLRPDSEFVETGEADECTETIATPDGEQEVTYPCNLVEAEICYVVVEDPMGMPTLMPYPCGAQVNLPSSSTEADPICYRTVYGPMGQPQLMPWPCALDR